VPPISLLQGELSPSLGEGDLQGPSSAAIPSAAPIGTPSDHDPRGYTSGVSGTHAALAVALTPDFDFHFLSVVLVHLVLAAFFISLFSLGRVTGTGRATEFLLIQEQVELPLFLSPGMLISLVNTIRISHAPRGVHASVFNDLVPIFRRLATTVSSLHCSCDCVSP
jgi:hypothetical protein